MPDAKRVGICWIQCLNLMEQGGEENNSGWMKVLFRWNSTTKHHKSRCGGRSALSLPGHVVSLFPRVRWGAPAACWGGCGRGEAGQGLLRLPSAPHPSLGEEGAGRRRAAGHRRLLSAVCADGVQRGKTGVHSSNRSAAWLRCDSAHVADADVHPKTWTGDCKLAG